MSQQSLKDKTIKGTMWSAADAFLGQGVTFLVGIVLARLLSPDEYGLIGICLIFNTVLSGMVDSGFSNALIRKKDVGNEEYNTMFVTNMAISAVLYVVLFFLTPYISVFFGRTELISLIRVTGLILFFNALSLTHSTILTKRIDFKTKTKASVASAALSGFVGIGMAYSGLGVWSLVCQMLSKQLIYTLALWALIKWCPTNQFSKEAFRYMWGFGWKLLLSGLLSNIWNQLYQVVVGICYSPAILGQYTRSKEYANLLSSNLTVIVQRVSYPVLAGMQDDNDLLIAAYRKVIKMTMFVTCVCMMSLGAVAEPLIYCLIGEKWQVAATYLPLICISLSLYPLHAINLNMLQVLGRSDIYLYIEIVKKIISVIPICVGIFIDIYWMLVISTLTGVVNLYVNSWYTGKKLKYTFWMQVKDVLPSYGIAFLIAVVVYFQKYLTISNWIILILQVGTGMVTFFVICKIANIEEYKDIRRIISSYLNKSSNYD